MILKLSTLNPKPRLLPLVTLGIQGCTGGHLALPEALRVNLVKLSLVGKGFGLGVVGFRGLRFRGFRGLRFRGFRGLEPHDYNKEPWG